MGIKMIFENRYIFYALHLEKNYCIKKSIQKVNMYVSSNRGIKNEQKKYIPKNEYIILYSKIRI